MTNPDNVQALLAKEPSVGLLKTSLAARGEKRAAAEQTAQQCLDQWMAMAPFSESVAPHTGFPPYNAINKLAIVSALYYWKKTGGRPVRSQVWLDRYRQPAFRRDLLDFAALQGHMALLNHLRQNAAEQRKFDEMCVYVCERVAWFMWDVAIAAGQPPIVRLSYVVARDPDHVDHPEQPGILIEHLPNYGDMPTMTSNSRHGFAPRLSYTELGVVPNGPA